MDLSLTTGIRADVGFMEKIKDRKAVIAITERKVWVEFVSFVMKNDGKLEPTYTTYCIKRT